MNLTDNDEMKEFLRAKVRGELPSVEKRKKLREAFHISQRELARRLGVSSATMNGWESGRTNPSGDARKRYLSFLRSAEDVLAEMKGGENGEDSSTEQASE